MGKVTSIGWANVPGYIGGTWNCWQGCHPIGPACEKCYMYREKKRYGQDPSVVVRSKPATFNLPLRTKEPHSWFVCSWSDFFIEEADPWREEAWDIIRECSQHLFLILTKRPERMDTCLPPDWSNGQPNVWLGVTAENQKRADERIPLLLQTPALVRFVSVEPMLGLVKLPENWSYIQPDGFENNGPMTMTFQSFVSDPDASIDWILIGGESGPGARPMNLDWARSILNQCREAQVKAYVKQLGGWPDQRTDPAEWPEDLRVQEFPNGF